MSRPWPRQDDEAGKKAAELREGLKRHGIETHSDQDYENDRNFFGFGHREARGLASENGKPYGLDQHEAAIKRRTGEDFAGDILSRRLW
jgi:hypothetical protein